MRRLGFRLLVGMTLLGMPVCAQDIPVVDTDSLATDSLAIDSLNMDPEWYVAPLVREADFAPRRAAAANCPVDSVLTFNVDSILSEVTVYEYGDTTRTMVWTVNADGSRIGKSRTESASTATTSYSATYAWDANTNNWKGTSKEEHTYNSANKETLRVLYNTWLNNAWLADTKYTWTYDASNREHEYTTYTRNTSTNELVLSQQRIREYNAAGKTTLDIQYTAHNGSTWSAGTQKIYDFDAAGNQIEYTYYSSLSNGNWVGSTHEKWTYTSGKKTYYEKQTWSNGGWVNDTKEVWEFNTAGKQTLHEKYNGSNSTWTLALQENSGYDEVGNNTLIENYSLTNNVWTGTKKEEYTFNAAKKKTCTIVFTWSNGEWVGNTKEVWVFNASNKQTLHEKYNWSNNDWSLTLQENSGYDAAGNNDLIENYNVSNGTFTGTKKEEYTFKGTKKTVVIKYKWSNGAFVYNTKAVTDVDDAGNSIETANYNWLNDAWVGTGTRTLQTFNSSKKVTEKITQTWPTGSADWVNKTCTTTVYSGANKTQEVYYNWSNDAWVGTKRTDYHYNASNKNDTTTSYTYSANDWIYATRMVNTFNANGTNIMTHNAKWQNNAWVMTSMTRTDISDMTVDGIRQTLYAQWQCGADSVWKGVQMDTSAYSQTGKKIFEARYTSWANNEWVPSYKIEHEYDEMDREIVNCRMNWVNNKWQGHYLFEYEYDEQDRQIAYTYYGDWSNSTNSWVGSSKYDYEYASNGQYSKQVMYKWQNNQWVGLFQYFYTYDAANHEIEQLVQSYSNGDWKNSQLYIHEYNGSQILKNNEYRWINEQWTFSSRNESYYDEDAQAKLRRKVNGSWSNGNVISFTDNLYSYSCDPKYYTIRFVNYDGTELSSESIIEGETPVYNGEDPTKLQDTQYTYTFSGWTPSLVPVTGNATYTATYISTPRQYTITWLNEDGTEISHETLEYGATPTHADINKESTAEFTYTFAGWTPGIGIVTGDATYTATFSATKNSYTITWLNDDNTLIDQTLVEYGVVPTHVAPSKPSTDEHSYFFEGWTPEVVPVTGEATYKATYTETTKVYTITWLNEDGSELGHETLEYGATPTHTAPTKEATDEFTYTFAGWNPAVTSVTGDALYRATFTATKRSYTITWLNEDGSEIEHETLEYGATPEHADMSKDNTAEYTYNFKGWKPGIGIVTGDATYTADFDSIKNKYVIIFQNYDETELQRSEVEYGELPNYEGEDPTKPADAQDTYNFAGWDPQVVAVTGNATYTAQYTSTVNSYTITFKNGNEVLQTSQVAYGEMPVYTGAKPTKAATAQYTYDFSGWDSEIVAVTGAKTYNAQFTGTVNSYTITFMNGEEILQSSEVAYGETPSYTGATPTKPADAQDTYTFAGWSPEIVSVTGTATYTAQFNGTKNKYLITFKNGETELQSSEVDYGETPSYTGATPTKPADAQYTYTFSGWNPAIVAVTGIATYEAQFSSTVNKYTIKFMNGETELQSSEVEYGTEPVYEGATPAKDATAQYTYTFIGWDKEITSVTGNEIYTAQFNNTVNKYVITWVDENDTEISHETLEYGATPSHVDAEKENTAEWTYNFEGWSPAVVDVVGDATYKATFSQTKNSYTITWVDENDTEISHETLEYGATPSHADASKDNTAEWTYNFEGWTPAIVDVTGDATYKATFSQTKNTYTITFLNYDGTELQTGDVEYGVTPEYTGATPTKPADAQGTYTFAGWDEEIVAVTGAKTYTATFTGVKGTYTITFYFGDGVTILSQMELAYGEMPEMTLEPARLADPEFSYAFAGWEPAIAPVTADADYVAVYTATTNRYTIIFRNDDGTELQREVLEYGILPIYAGEEPTKEEDERYTYEFAGWKPAVDIAKADAVYTATYTATKKKKQDIYDIEAGTSATKIYIEGNIYILRAGHAYAPDGTKLY